MKNKDLIEFSLLRLNYDKRPIWQQKLGIYKIYHSSLGWLSRAITRLKYKKKLGSHIVNPYAEESYKRDQEELYQDYYEELMLINLLKG
jgi:hypothetical protein